MPSLMDLPCEVLEEIFLKLEVEDVIMLGSCSISLYRIVCQERLWRVLLAKTELVEGGRLREDRVRKITTFVSSLANSAAIFSLFNQTVYKRFPAIGWEEETVAMSWGEEVGLSYHDSVSVLGLELLILISREAARLTVDHENYLRNPWKSIPMMFFYLY